MLVSAFVAELVEMNVGLKFVFTEVPLLIWGSVMRTVCGNGIHLLINSFFFKSNNFLIK